METGRAKFDLGAIIREHGQEYERTHRMFTEQREAFRAIASCRTAALGGHKLKCPNCSYEEISYNSCRNNNCPKCQGSKRKEWVAARMEELLPVPYFHVVFTIPDFFNDLHYTHYKKLYNTLFKASSATILYFFKKKGGVPAVTAIAHSWGRTMTVHPHVHMLVTGGCMSFDRKKWIKIGDNYLFDVKELSAEFKRRFIKEIESRVPDLVVPEEVSKKDWVVFCKKPFAGAEVVVKYLGRYVKRSAIANSRITDVSDGKVTFEYKNYKKEDRNGIPATAEMTLSADEFIRRFMRHIPPNNFRKIRFYGITAGREYKLKLKTAKELTEREQFTLESESATIEDKQITTERVCPECGNVELEIIESVLPNGPPSITFENEKSGEKHAA